jgi:hypothetical protein
LSLIPVPQEFGVLATANYLQIVGSFLHAVLGGGESSFDQMMSQTYHPQGSTIQLLKTVINTLSSVSRTTSRSTLEPDKRQTWFAYNLIGSCNRSGSGAEIIELPLIWSKKISCRGV